jgi:hypothetical protein
VSILSGVRAESSLLPAVCRHARPRVRSDAPRQHGLCSFGSQPRQRASQRPLDECGWTGHSAIATFLSGCPFNEESLGRDGADFPDSAVEGPARHIGKRPMRQEHQRCFKILKDRASWGTPQSLREHLAAGVAPL